MSVRRRIVLIAVLKWKTNKHCKGCVYCKIIYYPDTNNYRIKKECEFKEISHELKERLLYDAFKKWVDKLRYQYLYDS